MQECFLVKNIHVDEAISFTLGNQKYQKRTLAILGLIQNSIAFFIMGFPFIFPTINCSKSSICESLEIFSNTATYEFKLYGENQYKISMIGTFYFIGTLMTTIPLNWASDNYGRKLLMRFTTFAAFFSLIFIALSWNYIVLYIQFFIMGSADVSIVMMTFVYIAEITKSENRNYYIGFLNCFWSLGTLIIPLIYLSKLYWRIIIGIIAFLFLIFFFLLRFLVESPKFLAHNNKNYTEASRALNYISLLNDNGEFMHQLEEDNDQKKNYEHIFSKKIIKKLVICSFMWFSALLGYFGLAFAVSAFFSDIYVGGAVMGVFDLISNFVVIYLSGTIGRKNSTTISFGIASSCLFLVFFIQVFLNTPNSIVIVILTVITKFSVSVVLLLLFIYTAELFPTNIRALAFGICNAFGRIGGILSSNLLEISFSYKINVSLMIGTFLGLSSLFSIFLEETLGKDSEKNLE